MLRVYFIKSFQWIFTREIFYLGKIATPFPAVTTRKVPRFRPGVIGRPSSRHDGSRHRRQSRTPNVRLAANATVNGNAVGGVPERWRPCVARRSRPGRGGRAPDVRHRGGRSVYRRTPARCKRPGCARNGHRRYQPCGGARFSPPRRAANVSGASPEPSRAAGRPKWRGDAAADVLRSMSAAGPNAGVTAAIRGGATLERGHRRG